MTTEIGDFSDQELRELMQECADLLKQRAHDRHDRIKKGMKLIAQECKGTDCKGCPFSDYCSAISIAELPLPDKWE